MFHMYSIYIPYLNKYGIYREYIRDIKAILSGYVWSDGEQMATEQRSLHFFPIKNGPNCRDVKSRMKAEAVEKRLSIENNGQKEVPSEDCPEIG